MEPGSLRVEDHVIIVLMLVVSAAIGLYYSVVKRKQESTTEYFLASRNMSVAPMALSYFATTVATGTMIGFPVEIYNYGAQIFIQIITIPFVIWAINQLVIPIFYSMKTACIFKYFEVRFSRGLACTVAGTSIINMICHSSVTLYGASIALEQATGLDWWLISSIMAAVCILYSTMGGIRGIIITDAVQAFTMLSSIVILVVMGVMGSNGIAYIWQLNYANDRLNFFNFDVDPRTRHTFWTATIGYGLLSLASTSTSQSFIQRFLVAPNVRKAQCANSLGVGMLIFQWLVCGCLGLIIFAFYHGCNIMTTGLITNANQLAPYFAKSIFSPYRCLSGIYFGALVSASLSTISSALNSTSAVIVETFIKPARPYMSDRRITIICKMTVLISGVITLVSISMVDQFPNLIQASIVVFSIFSAPLFMLYLIGICCPQANTKIATFSFVFSLLFTLWIAIGNVMLKTVNQPKPFLNDNCDMVIGNGQRTNNSFILQDWTNSTSQLDLVKLSGNSTNVATPPTTSKLAQVFPFSSVSYQWYSLIGMTSCLISFVVLTFVFGSNDDFKSLDDDDKNLIPDIIKKLHLKIKRKYRRIFLCDIYDK